MYLEKSLNKSGADAVNGMCLKGFYPVSLLIQPPVIYERFLNYNPRLRPYIRRPAPQASEFYLLKMSHKPKEGKLFYK